MVVVIVGYILWGCLERPRLCLGILFPQDNEVAAAFHHPERISCPGTVFRRHLRRIFELNRARPRHVRAWHSVLAAFRNQSRYLDHHPTDGGSASSPVLNMNMITCRLVGPDGGPVQQRVRQSQKNVLVPAGPAVARIVRVAFAPRPRIPVWWPWTRVKKPPRQVWMGSLTLEIDPSQDHTVKSEQVQGRTLVYSVGEVLKQEQSTEHGRCTIQMNFIADPMQTQKTSIRAEARWPLQATGETKGNVNPDEVPRLVVNVWKWAAGHAVFACLQGMTGLVHLTMAYLDAKEEDPMPSIPMEQSK
jgi:hypothetical protein